ncbi:MAG: zinc ribbon domain-containing protein [Terriglobia bacterium]
MAQFCTKCGTPIPEGMKFCTGCGATVGEPPAPVAASAAVQPPPAPGVQPLATTAPAASSGSPALKIVLIVLAVLILLGVLGIGACGVLFYRIKQRARQFERQAQVTSSLPAGTAQAPAPAETSAAPGQPAVHAVDMSVRVYPGATAIEGGGPLSPDAAGVKVQQFTTSDPMDQVAAFYKEKLGAKEVVSVSPGTAMVQAMGASGVVTTVSIAADSGTGKTKFTVTCIAKQ